MAENYQNIEVHQSIAKLVSVVEGLNLKGQSENVKATAGWVVVAANNIRNRLRLADPLFVSEEIAEELNSLIKGATVDVNHYVNESTQPQHLNNAEQNLRTAFEKASFLPSIEQSDSALHRSIQQFNQTLESSNQI